ncbi:ABC transporter ATP-binding protein [Vibrio hippocampi]|uniref:Spermidine/putrescine import ATP-binding protein PotA n=1 Tax=Vibrio hippocampi TaxID=654686 RepID=A0ABN8DIA4_9VIBR|nr:ABC transporter ATP-binding protein [Vibrio hippocampi]CAH0526175.1 Spermidine/putrescine import ATP-binding protein PotA [Vibrio hippocampi]
MSDSNTILECRNLNKSFGEFTAVHNLDLCIEQGEFFSILGPSGCGKTTLLRMLSGFETPTSGQILLNQTNITQTPPNRRPLNMVFQHLALFPNMSVADNVAFGLKQRGESRATIENKVTNILKRVDLASQGAKRVQQLSGGQKQRVALARSLVLEPSVLLLDEPLGALDLKLREQMKIELKHLQKSFGTTFIYITHDQSEALMMSDRVAVMNAGRFEQIGTPTDLYMNPLTPFVAEFVGQNNKIAGQVVRIDRDHIQCKLNSEHTVTLPTPQTPPLNVGQAISLYLRPESIHFSHEPNQDNSIAGQIKELLFDGAASGIVVTSDLGDLRLSITPTQLNQLQGPSLSLQDRPISIHWAPEQAIILEAQ